MIEYVLYGVLIGAVMGIWLDRLLLAERWQRAREYEARLKKHWDTFEQLTRMREAEER